MSGLLLMFLIKRAKKLVWASFKVTDSLVLVMLRVCSGRAVVERCVSWHGLEHILEGKYARGL